VANIVMMVAQWERETISEESGKILPLAGRNPAAFRPTRPLGYLFGRCDRVAIRAMTAAVRLSRAAPASMMVVQSFMVCSRFVWRGGRPGPWWVMCRLNLENGMSGISDEATRTPRALLGLGDQREAFLLTLGLRWSDGLRRSLTEQS
jgi:hypothetical protein